MSATKRAAALPGPDAGRVDELIEFYRGRGFVVESRAHDEVVLARTNTWPSVILGALIGGIGQSGNPSPRRQRLWLHVAPDGRAAARLHPATRTS